MYNFGIDNIMIIIEKNCEKLILIMFFNTSSLPLKNSRDNMIEEKAINQMYQSNHLIFIYIDNIYKIENSIKKEIEYIIAKGKIGIW